MKDKYEISIWEDCLDWGTGVSSIANYEFYGLQVPAGYESASQPEIKIAVIGSDTMTSPIRAEEPKLVQNINGTNVFTFKMRYKYNIQGETRDNPFLSLLVNERKVKVYWKNEWYDLVIKDCQESTDGKSITYTCKDLYINELSKNGFNLEFDTELMNNQGSTFELAQRILEGTDWGVRSATAQNNPSDITFQETEEPVYTAQLYGGLLSYTAKGLDRTNGQEIDVSVAAGQNILVFESVYKNHPSDFQFWWAGDDVFETDGSNMLVTNGQCLTIHNCVWTLIDDVYKVQEVWYENNEEHKTTVCELSPNLSISLDYRAKRLVSSQLLEADQLTGKQCLVYQKGDNKYYAYSETEYSSANLITNCITNNKDFVNTLGWIYDGAVSTLYPKYTPEQQDSYNGKGYLYLPAGTVAFNSGIKDFRTFIPNGFIKGERYIFRIKARTNNQTEAGNSPSDTYCDLAKTDSSTTPPTSTPATIHLEPLISKYTYNSQSNTYTPTGDPYFQIIIGTKPSISQIADWIEFVLVCTRSVSYNELEDHVGLFINNNLPQIRMEYEDYENNGIYPASPSIWIEDVMFFKRAYGNVIVQDQDDGDGYDMNHTFLENDYISYTVNDNNSVPHLYRCIRQNKGHVPTTIEYKSYDNYWLVAADGEWHSTDTHQGYVYPGSYNTDSLAKVIWKIYQPDSQIKSADDIEYLFSGEEADFKKFLKDNSIVPKYGPNGRYEKIRSITGKQSNRFNLLQSIAETFQVWIKFVIEHESDGRTKRVSGKPVKYIRFLNTVGENNGLCFTYGIDLKSISRTINSDTITSKVIVSQNNNEFGKDGFCSIARAKDNYPMVDYILNFDYYFSHNLLSKDMVMNDLYYIPANSDIIDDGARYLGYYTRLHKFNSKYDAATQKLLQKNLEYTKADSKREFIEAAIKSTNQEIESLQNDLANYAGYQTYDADKVQAYLDGRGANDTTAHNAWETMWSLCGQLEVYEAQYSNIVALISDLENIIQEQEQIQSNYVALIKQIDDKFFSKYAHFIQEGTWTSDQYYDDDLYYFDALSTSYTSSRPQITYNIAVFRISSIKGFENKIFRLGDIAYVQDTEFFGYQADRVTPYKEEVIISEITSNFDAPQNDEIKVQNHKTQFEDLFQRIAAATQSLQFSSGAYDNTVNNFTHGGTLKGDNLQDSINQTGDLSWAADNNTVLLTKEGLMIMDPENPSKIVKITPSGISFTEDGGGHWSPAITGKGTEIGSILPGLISTDRISIMGGKYPTFNWDHRGINAYSYTESSGTNPSITDVSDRKFVTFDRFGLYGIDKTGDSTLPTDWAWNPTSEQSIFDNAHFGFTWNSFFLKRAYDNGYVGISSNEDFVVHDGSHKRIWIGNTQTDPSLRQSSPRYGMNIYNSNGDPVLTTQDSAGIDLWLKSGVGIGGAVPLYYDAQASKWIYAMTQFFSIPPTPSDWDQWTTDSKLQWLSTKKVIDANNNFVVYGDGHAVAKNIVIEGGTIEASSTFIGNIGGFNAIAGQLVSTNQTGPTLILNGSAGTISGLYTEITDTLAAGETSITFTNNNIKATSKVMPWFDEYGVVAKDMTISTGEITLVFDARQSDLGIKLEVRD